jgi:hypothetical protein
MRCTGFVAVVVCVLLSASTAAAAFSYFDNVSDFSVVAGPPYPTACHLTDVAHEVSSAFECDGRLSIAVERAFKASGATVRLDLRCLDDEPHGGGFAEDTALELTYDPGYESERTASTLRVDLHSVLTATCGHACTLEALRPELLPADPARYFDVIQTGVSAEVTCRVGFDRGVTHELTLLVETPGGVTLEDVGVFIRPQTLSGQRHGQPSPADSYFTSAPHADFDTALVFETEVQSDEDWPLATLTFSGRFIGGSSPADATSWGKIKSLYSE